MNHVSDGDNNGVFLSKNVTVLTFKVTEVVSGDASRKLSWESTFYFLKLMMKEH